MAPEQFLTMEANELGDLAQRIREWQTAKKLSDVALLKKLPQLGSTKTFHRVLNNDLAELDLDRQLAQYRAAISYIETMMADGEGTADPLYDDFRAAVELRRAVAETVSETSDSRLIFILGPTASGKTSARRALMEKYGARFMLVEASEVWNDSPNAFLGAILDALGKKEKAQYATERMEKAVELLNTTRRGLIIEEGHHLGPRCLNTLKTLINKTPGEFILIAIDTLWRKLETAAYEEARQLTGNRLAERINLGTAIRETDVRKMIERRLPTAEKTIAVAAARTITEKASSYGRFAFVREVIRRVATKADGEAITLQHFSDSISEEVSSR